METLIKVPVIKYSDEELGMLHEAVSLFIAKAEANYGELDYSDDGWIMDCFRRLKDKLEADSIKMHDYENQLMRLAHLFVSMD